MPTRNSSNKLQKWEASLIKAMLAKGTYANQEILAYFSRPGRSINPGRIVDIKKDRLHKTAKVAADDELKQFLDAWPMIDWDTGLHVLQDELLVKAREAMIFAVQAYNNPKSYFRSEVFIVTAIIAWTYLLHAFFRLKGIDYRYFRIQDGKKIYDMTRHGAQKHWELSGCLEHASCPLDRPTKLNLMLLIEIRNEIEHQMTQRIDDALSAKLQACCLNFNRVISELFGKRLAMDNELSFALQFSTFSLDQQKALFNQQGLPANIETALKSIEAQMSEDERNEPSYAFRIALVQKSVSNKGAADQVVEFVKSDSQEAEAINRILLKETEKRKYKPKQIVAMMRDEGYSRFNTHHHTELWQKLDGKNPAKAYGVELSDKQWYWYGTWLDRVREHCKENQAKYAAQ